MKIKRLLGILFAASFIAALFLPVVAEAASSVTRIKDIARVQGVRNNQLMGYGLVVGLQGTGDSDKVTETVNSIVSMLKSYGITIPGDDIKPDNVAAVMVTATLPPYAMEGDPLDITISSIGDAESIQGGTLLQTPLLAGNGQVYAAAQGAVSTGGFTAGRGGNTAQKNFPTVGTSVNGAIVEKSLGDSLGEGGKLSLSLNKPDFTTAARMAQSINARFGGIATATTPGRIDMQIPPYFRGNVVGFVSEIEGLPVMPDNVAKVVLNERTGTIVMGGDVTVDECAITQGGLTIQVTSTTDVNQPNPFSFGSTVIKSQQNTETKEEPANTIVLPATSNINDIVGALNSVGATPRDIISIIQAMKAAGAIHADVELV